MCCKILGTKATMTKEHLPVDKGKDVIKLSNHNAALPYSPAMEFQTTEVNLH